MAEVEYYGAEWCRDCRRSKALLEKLNITYSEYDVEASKENTEAAQTISGKMSIPVIRFADGEYLVEPSDAELTAQLEKRGLVS
jgi:glutaredoxin